MIYRYSIALIFLFTFGCSTDNISVDNSEKDVKQSNHIQTDFSDSEQTDVSFDTYLKSLDRIPLPLKYHALEKLPELSTDYNRDGFERFKHAWANQPLGILNSNDKIVTLVHCSIGDMGLVPFFTTYDRQGNKLDSLGPFKKTGDDMGYHAMEYMTIENDREIIMMDTVERYSLTPDETQVDESTRKIEFGKTIYHIDDEGHFVMKASH
jgi:hypothetical protein